MAKQQNKISGKSKSAVTELTVSDQLGTLMVVPIRQVDARSFTNQRTGDFTIGDSNEDGTDQSFAELVASIDETGQKDPITIRRKKGGVFDNGMPFEVIKGFRRFAAVNLIAQRDGTLETAGVKAILKDLSDLEALEENVFENTARDNLTGPDLAWAAFNLQEQYKSNGVAVSDNILAKKMGKNQSYISKIKKIVQSAPIAAKAWQQAKSPLTVEAMDRIAKLDPDKQEAEYERIVKALGGKGNARGGTKPPVETATNQATKLARLLGNLVSQGLITTDINWEANLDALGIKVADLTVQDKRAIAKLAFDEYVKACQPKTAKQAAAETAEASTEEPIVSAEN